MSDHRDSVIIWCNSSPKRRELLKNQIVEIDTSYIRLVQYLRQEWAKTYILKNKIIELTFLPNKLEFVKINDSAHLWFAIGWENAMSICATTDERLQVITSIPTSVIPKTLRFGKGDVQPTTIMLSGEYDIPSSTSVLPKTGVDGAHSIADRRPGQALWLLGLTRLQTQVHCTQHT